jgi:hypothetical protein
MQLYGFVLRLSLGSSDLGDQTIFNPSRLSPILISFYLQFTFNVLLLKRRPEEAVSSIVLSSMFMSGFVVALLYSITHNSLPPGAIIPTANFLLLDVSMAIPTYLLHR